MLFLWVWYCIRTQKAPRPRQQGFGHFRQCLQRNSKAKVSLVCDKGRSLRHKPRSGLPLCGCASGTTHTRVGGVRRRKAACLGKLRPACRASSHGLLRALSGTRNDDSTSPAAWRLAYRKLHPACKACSQSHITRKLRTPSYNPFSFTLGG